MIVEFIGGPLDGELRDVGQDSAFVITSFERPTATEWVANPGAPVKLRMGIYRARWGKRSEFVWLGEEDAK